MRVQNGGGEEVDNLPNEGEKICSECYGEAKGKLEYEDYIGRGRGEEVKEGLRGRDN